MTVIGGPHFSHSEEGYIGGGVGVLSGSWREAISYLLRLRPLLGGSPKSHVDLKKFPCPWSLFLQFLYRFLNGQMSHVDFNKYPVFVVCVFPLVARLHVACRFYGSAIIFMIFL